MNSTQKSPAKGAEQLMNDPIGFFDRSVKKMHSIDRNELEALQRQAMSMRFKEHYDSIVMLRNLADRLGITSVDSFDDLVPLLFPHTAFKSYPPSLLEKLQFDKMTAWLNRITSYDISRVDVAGCKSIDEWIDRLDEETPLELVTSSGTTGTISLIPKSKHGSAYSMEIWKMFLFQKGDADITEEEMNPEVDVIWPNFSRGKLGILRLANMLRTAFTGGDESRFHALYESSIDTDLMFLASKMRAAASRGELDRLKIDPRLLARRDEFIAMQERRPQEMNAFFEKMTRELAGKRVFAQGSLNVLYDIAAAGLERGISGVFAPNSEILTSGGGKGVEMPENFMEVITSFFGVERIHEGYGMTEISALHWGCEYGHYHVQPWVIPFLLDPQTSEPLPRKGTQTGRAAFYDFLNESHWGGVISGDEITIDWDTPCPCGQNSVFIHHDIVRYSDKEGIEDDRISCAATAQVNDEAINFMRGFEA